MEEEYGLGHGARAAMGTGLVFFGLFLLLSLITFSPDDPSFFHSLSQGYELQNGGGLAGAYLGGLLAGLLGLGSLLLPLYLLGTGIRKFLPRTSIGWSRRLAFAVLTLGISCLGATEWGLAHLAIGNVLGGGFLGRELHRAGMFFLPEPAMFLVWFIISLVSFLILSGLWSRTGGSLTRMLGRLLAWLEQRREDLVETSFFSREDEEEEDAPANQAYQDDPDDRTEEWIGTEEDDAPQPGGLFEPVEDEEEQAPRSRPVQRQTPARPKPRPRPAAQVMLPTPSLLAEVPAQDSKTPPQLLKAMAQEVSDCLETFNIKGQVQDVHPGPVVTMFEYKPAPGIKISRITNLSDDLALTLKAPAVRVEAPIPGKDAVGIEIPNRKRQTVHYRELVESKAFTESKSLLTLIVGKDISGGPQMADLAKMPHLLVAGATGAGKSVCLNSILLSFLYKARPEEVKLLLVDPKRIELAVYADLPHLVHPVVTDMNLAKSALDWAVHEMDQRYEAMARMGVRNIAGYNEKLKKHQEKGTLPESCEGLEYMPYLVIIIDELADLMLTAAKEVEMSIVRLAQLARAAGIHMILATQRPSVDVVTGLIKANFPCRIAFQVTSKHDSRTILDAVGAEYLLGKGDMLFKPSGGKMRRMHGAYVSDEDVVAVCDFWRAQLPPSYKLDFSQWQQDQADPVEGEAGGMDSDPMYNQAVDFIYERGKASISLLQRRFRIGYNKAARYIEQMELDGIVGPAEGSKPRTVLRKTD